MFDCHRHLTSSPAREDALYCSYKKNEWNQSAPFFSLGYLALEDTINIHSLLHDMEEKIASNPQVAIGEVGIDRRIPHMDVQIKIFQEILHLAVHYQRLVTLHVVRETGEALDLLKNQVQLPPLVIWHGFTGSIETAKELRKLGVEISLRPQVIRTKLVHNLEELNTLGFILETDWSGENDNGYEEVLNNHVKKMRELSNNEYIEEKCDGIRSILKDLQTNR